MSKPGENKILLRTILLTALFFTVSGYTANAASINYKMLTDQTCSWETRGELLPDDAVGADREVGRCQIKIETARLVGYKGTRRDLMERGGILSKSVAQRILRRCATALKSTDTHRILFCYNAGPSARYRNKATAWHYANEVSRAYQFAISKNGIMLARR